MVQQSAFGQTSPKPPVDSRQADFFDATLKPFQDEKLFFQQMASENPFLRKHPELRKDIADVINADDDQSILDIVDVLDLWREVDTPTSASPFRAIVSQLTLDRDIDDIKIKTKSVEANTDRSNAIMVLTARHMIDAAPSEQLDLYLATARFIAEQIKSSKNIFDGGKKWFDVKISNIELFIEQRILLERYFDGMPEKDPQPVSPEQIEQDTADIAELFAEARTKQRYGVKIGYKEQDYRPGSLVFTPPVEVESIAAPGVHPLTTQTVEKNSLAGIMDSDKTSFKKKIGYKNTPTSQGMFQIGLGLEGRQVFSLQENGELATGHTDKPLAITAAERGAYNAYRHLQAEVLAAYIDLTTPLELSRKTRDVRAPKAGTTDYNREPGVDIVRKLLVPRIKATDTENDGDGTPREIRLHGVVWHIRVLPAGFHASPQAQRLADEAHITLAEGETFVRAHQRGSKTLGEVVTHNLVNR